MRWTEYPKDNRDTTRMDWWTWVLAASALLALIMWPQ